MATGKKTQVIITANAATAIKVVQALQQHIDKLKQRMASLDVSTKEGKKEFNALQKELMSCNSVVTQNISSYKRMQSAIKNLSSTSLKDLRRALAAAKTEMGKLSESDKRLPLVRKRVETLQGQIDKMTGSINKQGNAWNTALKNLVAYVGLFAVFNKAKDLITGVIRKNFEMSDSLADIRKVSGLMSQDIDKMAVSLSKIDTRTPVAELQKIAYAGAKLGIGNYGAEGLESFVKASNQVNVALKEDLGDEALTALAKITEVMGLIPKMGVEQSMLKVGSSIFKLASTTTATSNKIVDFSSRLLSMGKTGALSTSDILALGAAVDSMAMEPEVASTAFSKLITEMRKGTNLIEKDLGLAKGSLKALLEEGKGMEALQTIFHKMHEDGNVFALDGLFKDLGSECARLIKVMVTMADKVDMLDRAVKTSKDAFNEGIAVTQEYNIQQETANGILERANNMWNKAFVNPDGINSVKQIATEWYNFSRALTESSYSQKAVTGSLTALIVSLKILVNILPGIMGFVAGQGLVRGSMLIYNITKAVMAWVAAQRALNLAMSANVFGALVGALALAYTWFQKDANAAEDAANSTNRFTKSLRGAKNEVGKAIVELDGYKKAIDNAKKGTNERQAAIDNFNEKFGSYLSNLLTEKSTAQDVAQAYKEAAQAIERKIMLQNKSKDLDQHVAPKAGREAQLLYDYDQKARESGKGQYNGEWLRSFVDDNLRTLGTTNTINELIKRSNVGAKLSDRQRAALMSSLASTNGEPAGQYEWTNEWDAYGQKVTKKHYSSYTGDEKQVAMAIAYIRQRAAREKAQDDVAEKYKYYPDTTLTEDVTGVDASEKLDKDALKKAAKDKREQERSWREELKQKQDEANAVMDNVDNFYDRQINAKLQEAIDLGMNKAEQQLYIEPLKQKKNTAREQVRLAVVGKQNSWNEILADLPNQIVEKADETGVNLSEELLKDISKVDIEALRKKLSSLANNLDRPLSSVYAEMFAKATRNAQANLKLVTQQQEARRKTIQEHDYTGIVKQNAYDIFNTMGYANPTEEETTVNKSIVDGKEVVDTSAFDNRKKAIESMFEKARTNISQVFGYDMSKEEDRGLLMQLLFGDDPDKLGLRIAKTLGKDAAEWQAFYQKLIQYNDEYEAASKKRDDERKRLNDYAWSKEDYYKEYQKALPGAEQEVAVKGSYRNAGQRMGMESVSASDPELELMKARMEFAQRYYTFLEEHNATEQQLADARKSIMAEQANYAKKLTEDMFEQYNSLLTFMGPLQTFGESVGDAFATMTESASEGRKQLKSALKQMVKSFATSSLQMISQQQIDRARTTAHYAQLLLMQQAFGTAKVGGEAATGAALLTTKTVNNQTEEQLETTHQEAMAALRSAGIFGWCVSTLGPIAGPIAYAAMMATLMGLLNFAISKIGSRNKSTNDTAKANNVKVTSGMLTYDSGNVQGMMPYVSESGDFYLATPHNGQHRGVSLLTQPTATTINGQPSLVAENGPEIVIGRETTRAMQMNNPQLLRALVNFDRNFSGRKAYDAGNLSEADTTATPVGASVQELVASSAVTNMALQEAVTALLKRLDAPIEAKINMYGYGQLYDSMKKAERFMRNK